MSLSDRIRPNIEAAPWVVEEIAKLEQQLATITAERDKLDSIASELQDTCDMQAKKMAAIEAERDELKRIVEESRKQEPVGYVSPFYAELYPGSMMYRQPLSGFALVAVYAAPVIKEP